jgi:hypothetical protein
VRNWFSGAHEAQGVRCIDCHAIHKGGLHGERMALLSSGGEVLPERRPIESRRDLSEKCTVTRSRTRSRTFPIITRSAKGR